MDIQSIYPACLGIIFGLAIVFIAYSSKEIANWLFSQEAKVMLGSLLILTSPFIFQIFFQKTSQSIPEMASTHTVDSSLFGALKGLTPFLIAFLTFFLGRYGKFKEEYEENIDILQNPKDELDENYIALEQLTQLIGSNTDHSLLDNSPYIPLNPLDIRSITLPNFFWDGVYYKSIDVKQIRVAIDNLTVFRKLRWCYKRGKELQQDVAKQVSLKFTPAQGSGSNETDPEDQGSNRSIRRETYENLRVLRFEVKKLVKDLDSIKAKYSRTRISDLIQGVWKRIQAH